MTSKELENLAKTGKLKVEPGDQLEFEGLLQSARARLADARIETLAIESRFDLAYNASHALALATLRWSGYRSESRYLVFQCLQHTVGLGPEVWRVLSLCHDRRNRLVPGLRRHRRAASGRPYHRYRNSAGKGFGAWAYSLEKWRP